MKTRTVLSVVLGVVVIVVGVFIAINRSGTSDNSSLNTAGLNVPPQATAIHHYGAEYGKITDSIISPDNVTFKIEAVQRGTGAWLFHIHAHNNAAQTVSILDATTNHYFMIGGKGGIPGTPVTAEQAFRILAPMASSSLGFSQADKAAHPALAATVAAGADTDGWLVADLSTYKFTPFQLMYVYGTVTAPACTNPQDPSTCQPSTGYRTIIWQL